MKTIIVICFLLFITSAAFAPMIKNSKANRPEGTIKLFTVTAYCPCEKCCGRFADGTTASGHRIAPGDKIIAAPTQIPFGTKMVIPGYGTASVLDRGGAIKGNKLDVLFPTHQEALRWGVQFLPVKIFTEL